MQFIYFIGAALKKKVLAEGIHVRPNRREINQDSTGIFCYPLVKIPFRVPVLEADYEDVNNYLAFKKEEQLLNESLTMEEAWEVVGASRARKHAKRVKKVIGVIFEPEPKHWPMTVFIDIRHFWAPVFAQLLFDSPSKGITFRGYKNSLLELVKKLEYKRYVIASAPFTVDTEEDLLNLIGKFKLSGGGIWKEDSFECMLTESVSSQSIKQIIRLENKYYDSVLNNATDPA